MKLSTRARYGTRALLDLAIHYNNEPVQLKDIAHRQEISLNYLEQIIAPLIRAGIVRSIRGARGGVQLAKQTREVKLSDVMRILEGSISPVECLENPKSCSRSRYCATYDIWSEMKQAMDSVLESTTLQDLVEQQQRKGQPEEATHHTKPHQTNP